MRGSKPVPVSVFLMAMMFCTINGYMQSRSLLHYYSYSDQWFYDPRPLIGIVLFLFGLTINIHSDIILRNLRKPNETGYKIPKGVYFKKFFSWLCMHAYAYRWFF